MNDPVTTPPPASPSFFRPIWTRNYLPPWLITLIVTVALGALRTYSMLGPRQAQPLYLFYCAATCCLAPILLTWEGRREIGLCLQGVRPISVAASGLAGVGCAVIGFWLGVAFFGDSTQSWVGSLRVYFRLDDMVGLLPAWGIIALYAIPAMTLTPIGEEILFRGILHQSFARRWNLATATLVNCFFYGLMYLYVHGLWHDQDGFHLRLVSGAVMVLILAIFGAVYTYCRLRAGSLLASMAAHAGFNFAMIVILVLHFTH